MDDKVRRSPGEVWFALAVALFVAALAYMAVVLLRGADLANAGDDAPLLILAVAGLVSLVGWWRDRSGRSAAEEEARRERERLESGIEEREAALREAREDRDSAREDEEARRRDTERLEARLKESEVALGRERYLRMRSESAHKAEKDWRQELHREVLKMSREQGVLGDPGDVPSMVLRLARTLVEAEKGLLLSRREGDEGLQLAAAEGFEHDPTESAIARRFAGEVLERDKTVREERPGRTPGENSGEGRADGLSPADEEIENLVAIPIYLQDEFSGVVVCANNPDGFEEYDDEVLLAVGDQAGAVLHNAQLRGELRASFLATVGVLVDAIEAKDPFLRRHSEEVSGYVAAVADRFELPPGKREELVFGSLLHDVGKIGVSERILLKPAPLTPEERAAIELHPRIGYRILRQVPALRPVAPAVLHHHERFDGRGYPSGLKGESIPLEARIICVADAFSAMISERPYRTGDGAPGAFGGRLTAEEACAELERNAGTQFDPGAVRVFVEEVRRDPPAFGEPPSIGDPELEVRREEEGPVLGSGALDVIDNLTLLYTRRHLHDAARHEAERAAVQGVPFGVVLVELTGLPEVNSSQGYEAGDGWIRTAARVTEAAAARVGGTACRYGGDRLALILPGAAEASAESLAALLKAEIGEGSKATGAASAAWRPDDTGEDVISRARARLGTPPVS